MIFAQQQLQAAAKAGGVELCASAGGTLWAGTQGYFKNERQPQIDEAQAFRLAQACEMEIDFKTHFISRPLCEHVFWGDHCDCKTACEAITSVAVSVGGKVQ